MRFPFLAVLLVVGCGSSVEDGAGGGGGGAPSDPAPSVIVQPALEGMVRIVIKSDPIGCEFSGSAFDLADCGSFAVEVTFPAERLQPGPLIQSDDVTLFFTASSDGDGRSCSALGSSGEEEELTVVIESLTDDTIEVRLSGFNKDIDGDGQLDTLIDGVHSGIRCDGAG